MRFASVVQILCSSGPLLCLSCSTPTSPPTSQGPPKVFVSELFKFGPSEIHKLEYGPNSQPELFLDWERNFGEPFTDNNGNGLYDEGIDGFIMSADPSTNQDLNHNGKYEGPNSAWTPGMPFDDIDGDGKCRRAGDPYAVGVPYCDLNENGMYDAWLSYHYEFVHWGIYSQDSSRRVFGLYRSDSAYVFTSDSQFTYAVWPGMLPYAPFDSLEWYFYFASSGDGWDLLPDSLSLFNGDTVEFGTTVDTVHFTSYHPVYKKTTSFHSTITIGQGVDSNIVSVRFDLISTSDAAASESSNESYVEAFLSPSRGPIAVTKRFSATSGTTYYLGKKAYKLPLSMNR